MAINWNRSQNAEVTSKCGRYRLINHSAFTGKKSTHWNVLIADGKGDWSCDETGSSLREAKLIAEDDAARLINILR